MFVIISLHNCVVISFVLFLFGGNNFIQNFYLPQNYIDRFFLTSFPTFTSVGILIVLVLCSAFLLLRQGEGVNLRL
ncbi:CTAGE1 isoform 1, partial [Pongo abelii]|uniref:CTAGE1 isoform 1 n=1 Tax=Pongo abelii TaxID=9601 RepID=H2NW11_PONAB